MTDHSGTVVATRHHAGGWWIRVLQFEVAAYAWTLDGDDRAGRMATSLNDAQRSADAWLLGLDHDCVALGCGAWTYNAAPPPLPSVAAMEPRPNLVLPVVHDVEYRGFVVRIETQAIMPLPASGRAISARLVSIHDRNAGAHRRVLATKKWVEFGATEREALDGVLYRAERYIDRIYPQEPA